MMIDVHTHIIPPRVLELVGRDPRYDVKIIDNRWMSKHIAPFVLTDAWFKSEAKLREMDEQELDISLLSAAPKPLFYYDLPLEPQLIMARETNAGLAEFCRSAPARLYWMAHIPMGFPDVACKELEAAVSQGAIGVEIGTSVDGRRLDAEEFEPLWTLLEKLDIPVFLHPAYERDLPEYKDYRLGPIVGLPVEVTVTLERMIYRGVFDRHPGLKVIAALGGGFFPYNAGRLRHYVGYDPAFASTSKRDPWSYVGQIIFDCFLHDVGQIRFLIEQAGADNVVLGTDASFRSLMPKPVQMVREAVRGDEAVVRQIGETNPRRLFKL